MSARSEDSPLLGTLVERLRGAEGLELEYKAARGNLPASIWPTISAFANTRGGWIILGVRDDDPAPVIEGVTHADKLLQDLANLLRNPQKISCAVCSAGDMSVEALGGKQIVLVRVPAASRKDKPVYVGGNPYAGTFLRRHAGDFRCNKAEVDRMMREASDVAADSAIISHFTQDDLNPASIERYRRRHERLHPTSVWSDYGGQGFLQAIGAIGRDRERGQEGITVAGLLLLGKPEALREWRSRHLIDYRSVADESDPDERWQDRVAWDGNLLDGYEAIYPRLTRDLPVPFRLEGDTRVSESRVHVALREALVNLLVHADYAETQASLIVSSPTRYTFRNPGSSRVPEADLFAGDRSDPRNPILLSMFRYVGLAEEAGTGIPSILRAWRELGYQIPKIDVGTERYEFTIVLRPAHLFSDADRVWLRSLPEPVSEPEQFALLMAKHEGDVDNLRLRGLTGQHPSDVTKLLGGLRDRGLLRMSGARRGARYLLGPQALGSSEGMQASSEDIAASSEGMAASSEGMAASSEGIAAQLPERKQRTAEQAHQLRVVAARAVTHTRLSPAAMRDLICDLCAIVPLSTAELSDLLGRHQDYLRPILRDLVADGRLLRIYPEQPTHPQQRYATRAAT